MNNRMVIGVSIALLVSGCGLGRPYPQFWEDGEQGRFEMSADSAGMREFGTALAGIIRDGKAPDNVATTPYWEHRKEQERGLVLKKMSPETPGFGKMIKDFLTGKSVEGDLPLQERSLPVSPTPVAGS